jgi:asparagine synthase (glutamine-hydrolysing)
VKVWALERRTPWVHLLFETAAGFLPSAPFGAPEHMRSAPWLRRNFVKCYQPALTGYPTRLKLFGPLPSFQENLATLDLLRRQLHCDALSSAPTYEKRYPYLDRGLLEFLYAVPREQLVRPGQRRSLMRRALVGIVPNELLNRKRKAFVASVPAAVLTEWVRALRAPAEITGSAFGIVETEQLLEACDQLRRGQLVPIVPLMRTFLVEAWLKSLYEQRISTPSRKGEHRRSLSLPSGKRLTGQIP